MSQDEVYQFLKKNKGKWFTAKDVAEGMNQGVGSITNNLFKLRRNFKEYIQYKIAKAKYGNCKEMGHYRVK